ncbi:hypothetical protein PoB_006573800 [Plakobranchus ocellatus]|uniref:Uncharacterized protein n=1 Tax=Plakobranchus ocellatus TaxID=259542 RepID=A0AAV4D5B3_9GAST|nr:hypothetical protein PoB_006573800 [Plakobranchus ocellatus]
MNVRTATALVRPHVPSRPKPRETRRNGEGGGGGAGREDHEGGRGERRGDLRGPGVIELSLETARTSLWRDRARFIGAKLPETIG